MLIGWRLWRYRRFNDSLSSVTADYAWKPGKNSVYDYLYGSMLIRIGLNNDTGFYCYKDSSKLSSEIYTAIINHVYIIGTIVGWGKYVEHETGYRFEYAQIHSLYGWVVNHNGISTIITINELNNRVANRPFLTDDINDMSKAIESRYGINFYTGEPFLSSGVH